MKEERINLGTILCKYLCVLESRAFVKETVKDRSTGNRERERVCVVRMKQLRECVGVYMVCMEA